MSLKHLAWAWGLELGDPISKLVMLSLANRANAETGQCWPSLSRISQDTEASLATVKRKLSLLEERGYLRREQRDKTSTMYTIDMEAGRLSVSQTLAQCEPAPRLSVSHEPISKKQKGKHEDIDIDQAFDDWWSIYPRKIGKGQAKKSFRKALSKAPLERITAATEKFVDAMAMREKKYIPHPATWLNGERWDDETETASTWGDINEL
jgi:DNA-binding transcriptional MocR family regulator